MRLETERLVLRQPEEVDFPAYAAYARSARSTWTGGPQSDADMRQTMTHIGMHWQGLGFGLLSVLRKGATSAIAFIGPQRPPDWPETELSWMIFDPADEGAGIATEAAITARRWAYEALGLKTLVSYIHPDNTRSLALAKRLSAFDDTTNSPLFAAFPDTLIFRHPGPEALS